MKDHAYIFYPHPCIDRGAMCNLHVVLHGCGDSERHRIVEQIGRYWGKYAASNNLILLYPFVIECWDTYGYTGENYATRDAIQPKALMAMIKRVTS